MYLHTKTSFQTLTVLETDTQTDAIDREHYHAVHWRCMAINNTNTYRRQMHRYVLLKWQRKCPGSLVLRVKFPRENKIKTLVTFSYTADFCGGGGVFVLVRTTRAFCLGGGHYVPETI